MLTLSESLKVAEIYEKQAFISNPAQATIKLKNVLKGILGDEVYQLALKGDFDESGLREGEVS